jgi:hypothetical protein
MGLIECLDARLLCVLRDVEATVLLIIHKPKFGVEFLGCMSARLGKLGARQAPPVHNPPPVGPPVGHYGSADNIATPSIV